MLSCHFDIAIRYVFAIQHHVANNREIPAPGIGNAKGFVRLDVTISTEIQRDPTRYSWTALLRPFLAPRGRKQTEGRRAEWNSNRLDLLAAIFAPVFISTHLWRYVVPQQRSSISDLENSFQEMSKQSRHFSTFIEIEIDLSSDCRSRYFFMHSKFLSFFNQRQRIESTIIQ